jgi:APA family basic amino acid/polyamine antiporter
VKRLLRTHSIDALIKSSEHDDHRLHRTLGPWSLTAFGVGAVIGSGIFILTGTAAAGQALQFKSILNAPILDLILNGGDAVSTIGRQGAGPAISLSFLVTAFVCSFAALCYAELASMIPIAGSAYTYAYATLGEIFAWIIGWDLILEYAVSNMAVAVGFSAYLKDLLEGMFGLHLPYAISGPPIAGGAFTGTVFNLPALLILMLLTWVLVRGVRESASTNNAMVLIKVAAILIFVIGAGHAVKTSNWVQAPPRASSTCCAAASAASIASANASAASGAGRRRGSAISTRSFQPEMCGDR